MKRIIIIIVVLILSLTGCDMLYPMQNTPTPQITPTPTPIAIEPTPTEYVTPQVLYTAEPTNEYEGLMQVSPTIVETASYMANGYYKAGDGFRDAVDLEYIGSSSHLSPQAGYSYAAANLYDFDLSTVWCEGRTSYGIGEWVEYSVKAFDYAPNAKITKLEIINGYIKSDDAFYGNSMVKKLLVSVDNEECCMLNFTVSKEIQQFDIPDIELSSTDAKIIKFEIVEVFEGEKYKDTCITAIEFAGTGIY